MTDAAIRPAEEPESLLSRESRAGRRVAPERGRVWRVISTEHENRFGQPVGFTLYPEAAPTLLAAPGSSLQRRAGFATNHLWVTRYNPAHRYPAGDFVNQHPGGAGIEEFIAGDEDIDGTDVVLWHTFGPAHFPRTERPARERRPLTGRGRPAGIAAASPARSCHGRRTRRGTSPGRWPRSRASARRRSSSAR